VSGKTAETPAGASRDSKRRVPAETPPDRPACPGCRPAGHPARPGRCHLEDGPALSPAAAQAIACRATITWMLHDHDGTLLDAGRRHRRPTPALRRAVRERDKARCQYPGCHSRRTDIHHIIAWAKGGKTRLRDLILLCEAHHVIVHALGYLITTGADGAFTFTRPDGQIMPAAPDLPGSDGDDDHDDLEHCHDADITADTIIPDGLADKLDLELAIWAAFANTRPDRQASQQQHDQDLAA
jgi:5-methylcytosine-specific restriction endonuclease McrA